MNSVLYEIESVSSKISTTMNQETSSVICNHLIKNSAIIWWSLKIVVTKLVTVLSFPRITNILNSLKIFWKIVYKTNLPNLEAVPGVLVAIWCHQNSFWWQLPTSKHEMPALGSRLRLQMRKRGSSLMPAAFSHLLCEGIFFSLCTENWSK